MEKGVDSVSVDSKDIIEGVLRDKRYNFLIKKGHLEKKGWQSKIPGADYKLKNNLFTEDVVNEQLNYFNELKSNIRDPFDLEALGKAEMNELRKDGLVEERTRLSEKGYKVVMQAIDDFIASKIIPRKP